MQWGNPARSEKHSAESMLVTLGVKSKNGKRGERGCKCPLPRPSDNTSQRRWPDGRFNEKIKTYPTVNNGGTVGFEIRFVVYYHLNPSGTINGRL